MNKSPHGEPAPFKLGQQNSKGAGVSVTGPHMIATEHKIPSCTEERNLHPPAYENLVVARPSSWIDWITSSRELGRGNLGWCVNRSWYNNKNMYLPAAAKSLQSCPTLCNPIDGSPLGSSVPGILQARTLEWVAISSSNVWKWKVKVKSLSCARLLATPWTAAYQAPPSMGFSRQEYWSGVPLPFPMYLPIVLKFGGFH